MTKIMLNSTSNKTCSECRSRIGHPKNIGGIITSVFKNHCKIITNKEIERSGRISWSHVNRLQKIENILVRDVTASKSRLKHHFQTALWYLEFYLM